MTDQLQLEMGAGMADIADIVSGVRERSITRTIYHANDLSTV